MKNTLIEYPYTGLIKVISGGQDGADLGGLEAAFECGISTGGWCPRYCRTASGTNEELVSKYGLVETLSGAYPVRTNLNVKDSDGTIRFASDFSTAGEICTLNFINKHKKPYLDINVLAENIDYHTNIINWINDNKISIVNIAGNRDKYARRGFHYLRTYEILKYVFKQIIEVNNAN